jgi:hypothetical protein
MPSTYRLARARYKRLADTLNALGLAALLGGVSDAIVSSGRPTLDRVGIGIGVLLLSLSVHLSRFEDASEVRPVRLTRFTRGR